MSKESVFGELKHPKTDFLGILIDFSGHVPGDPKWHLLDFKMPFGGFGVPGLCRGTGRLQGWAIFAFLLEGAIDPARLFCQSLDMCGLCLDVSNAVRGSQRFESPSVRSDFPVLPFLVFFGIPCFFFLRGIPCFFLSVFPSFSKDFRGSAGIRNPCFFGSFPCLFPKKQGKEGQGSNRTIQVARLKTVRIAVKAFAAFTLLR